MEEFTPWTLFDSVTYPSTSIYPSVIIRRPRQEIYNALKKDELKQSPEKMYLLSLATKEKLPDGLHDAMMLWSFDKSSKPYVQMYLEWINHCEDMANSRISFERRCKMWDRIILGSMIASGFALAAAVLFNEITK